MCAVLIAENTANAHHMPQSISENLAINPFGNKYRVHVRKQYERQVNQGGVVYCGGSRFVLGWVWVIGGWARSLAWGFWAAFRYAYTQVFGSVSAGFGHRTENRRKYDK